MRNWSNRSSQLLSPGTHESFGRPGRSRIRRLDIGSWCPDVFTSLHVTTPTQFSDDALGSGVYAPIGNQSAVSMRHGHQCPATTFTPPRQCPRSMTVRRRSVSCRPRSSVPHGASRCPSFSRCSCDIRKEYTHTLSAQNSSSVRQLGCSADGDRRFEEAHLMSGPPCSACCGNDGARMHLSWSVPHHVTS